MYQMTCRTTQPRLFLLEEEQTSLSLYLSETTVGGLHIVITSQTDIQIEYYPYQNPNERLFKNRKPGAGEMA